MTRANFVSGVGGAMTPAFAATLSADQALNDTTWTKINVNTELFDTDNCYDNSTNYRFTPTTAGKYFVYAQVASRSAGPDMRWSQTGIYKNGSAAGRSYTYDGNSGGAEFTRKSNYYARIFDMNGSSDYLELYGYIQSGSARNVEGGSGIDTVTLFGAYKIIE